MAKNAKILWVDLEMTGLDPEEDKILEVAAIATDWDFNEIAAIDAAIGVDSILLERRMQEGSAFWDKFPNVRDALRIQNDSDDTKTGRAVEDELLLFLDEHFDTSDQVLLAGNSIHQDRKFIEKEWKRFNARLHYRMLDVSAWKVVFDGKYKKRFAKPEAHRALDDIRGSIEELKYYLGKVRL